jgi:hypothetical protein
MPSWSSSCGSCEVVHSRCASPPPTPSPTLSTPPIVLLYLLTRLRPPRPRVPPPLDFPPFQATQRDSNAHQKNNNHNIHAQQNLLVMLVEHVQIAKPGEVGRRERWVSLCEWMVWGGDHRRDSGWRLFWGWRWTLRGRWLSRRARSCCFCLRHAEGWRLLVVVDGVA